MLSVIASIWHFPCALKMLFFMTFYFILIIQALNFEPGNVNCTHNGFTVLQALYLHRQPKMPEI